MNPPHPSASLYVGDLPSDISEGTLFELFKQAGPLTSIRVCRDTITRRSLGYAYVNYHSAADADKALDSFNGFEIKGKPCRVMWVQRDPSLRKSGVGNVFIKNLDKKIDHKALYDTFSKFGAILSCKVSLGENNESKGFGFVHYERQADADKAIAEVNGKELLGKIVSVCNFIPRKDRSSTNSRDKFTNTYVKDFPLEWDEAKLTELFGPFGEIKNVHLPRSADGKSKGFGFVNYASHESAAKAVAELHGKEIGPEGAKKKLYVARFQKKAERMAELRRRKDEIMQRQYEKWRGTNLYIKNIDDSIDEARLEKEFSAFGKINSYTIMKDEKNSTSKGFGFVCYSSPEEAERAISEMHGKMLGVKPLYVALAQRRDERRAQLEMHHQRKKHIPAGMYPPVGGPVYYGGPPPPGFFPTGMPNRRGAPWAPSYPPYAMPIPGAGVPPAGPGRKPRTGGRPSGPAPIPAAAAAPVAAPTAEPTLTLEVLKSLAPETQNQILGERLYTVIATSQPERVGKITGMLLERYKNAPEEILKLLDTPNLLAERVGEAVVVLEHHEKAQKEAEKAT
eukprot:TRINITY_DN2526_c0_g3_i1.p1 TRINITY_DN2526_c0_g3~~TRINITY_DN2526_c0_g3_i1.p1  ORF type:complete len:566 (+),score=150.86 TRINITY_DN2526_c0_g3_i1:61-1758(+)